MLFVLSKDGVPSESRVLRIGPSAPRPHLALTSALAAAEQHYYREGKTPIEIEDEEILRQSTGTRVTIGLTARCPYGLAACWAGAYEALTKLSGVEAVRPIANSDTSTADLFLRGQILPDLDRWPEEFAEWANRSYDFRGVEVKSRRRASGGGRRIRADRTHLPRAGAAASVGAGHEGPMGLCGAKAARGHIR
jgi:galactose oxidase